MLRSRKGGNSVGELQYNKDAARNLERIYRSPDVVAQRAATLGKLNIQPGETVIDIGSGPGFLCEEIASLTGPTGHVLGVDISTDLIELSRERNPPSWLSYAMGDATDLPTTDASFDVAACTQVAEYVPDVKALLSELFRVLKPGGRAIIVATDWDSVAMHTKDPDRMQRIMLAWEDHCAHPRLPRRLSPLLRGAGFDIADIDLFPLINLTFNEDTYSFGIANLIHEFVTKRELVPEADVQAWHEEFASLDKAGQYYFTSGRMMFTVIKPLDG